MPISTTNIHLLIQTCGNPITHCCLNQFMEFVMLFPWNQREALRSFRAANPLKFFKKIEVTYKTDFNAHVIRVSMFLWDQHNLTLLLCTWNLFPCFKVVNSPFENLPATSKWATIGIGNANIIVHIHSFLKLCSQYVITTPWISQIF